MSEIQPITPQEAKNISQNIRKNINENANQ